MKVMHIAPQTPKKNGIIDYAQHFRALIEAHTSIEIKAYRYTDEISDCATNLSQIGRTWKVAKDILKTIGREGIDLVHAEIGCTCYPEFYLSLFLGLQRMTVPLVVTFHDPPYLSSMPIQHFGMNGNSIIQKGFRKIFTVATSHWLESRVIKKSSHVIVLSEEGRKYACRRFPAYRDKFIATRHFIIKHNILSQRLDCISKDKMILASGFWQERKGYEILLDALNIIRTKRKDLIESWSICISGGITDTGKSLRYFRNISSRVANEGWKEKIRIYCDLPISEFDKLFYSAAIYVSTEHNKGTIASASGNLLRAIGHGCALLVSDIPGTRDIVKHGDNGFVFRSRDSAALAEGLMTLLASEETLCRFQKKNSLLAVSEYDGRNIIKEFEKYYRLSI